MTHFAPSGLPGPFASAIGPFARAFGIVPETAALLLLQATGAAAAGSIRTSARALFDCTPGFDIAGVHNGCAMLHPALLTALEGATEEITSATVSQHSIPLRDLRLKRQKLEQRAAELSDGIAKSEKRIQDLRCPKFEEPTLDRIRARMLDTSPLTEIARLETELPQLLAEQEEVQRELVDVLMTLYPAIIRERTDWRDLVSAGASALNGHVFQIATAGSLLSELSSKSNQLKACAELIARSRSESPISGFDTSDNGYRVCAHLFGPDNDFSDLLRSPRLQRLEMLKHFLFVEIDADEDQDLDALVEFGQHEWHGAIARIFRLRACGRQTRLELGRSGMERYFEFLSWWRDFMANQPAEYRPFFLRWPELMIRLATSMAVVANPVVEDILETKFVECAVGLLKDHSTRQQATLQRLLRPERAFHVDAGVEVLVKRLQERGPQTRRELARGISGQSYAVIDARLVGAISRGLVEQKEDGRFAAAVSVIASTEDPTTQNAGVVAA